MLSGYKIRYAVCAANSALNARFPFLSYLFDDMKAINTSGARGKRQRFRPNNERKAVSGGAIDYRHRTEILG